MADDPQRNFRSAYYEKVGFRGVEEKKSLEILLKDNPLGTHQIFTTNILNTISPEAGFYHTVKLICANCFIAFLIVKLSMYPFYLIVYFFLQMLRN